MASVKKGTLTRPPQWWKHLRKWKRVHWKKERGASKREIKHSLLSEGAALILVAYLAPALIIPSNLADEDFITPLVDVASGSGYGLRKNPVSTGWSLHKGIDYPAAINTPVRATRGGVVAFRGWAGGYGRLVRLTHGRGLETRYAHLDRWPPGLRVGVTISTGQIIGYVGQSGQATGPHLHYEVRRYGRPLNPNNL